MTYESKTIHYTVGKKFRKLDQPCSADQACCPDCKKQDGYHIIFEPQDGPERVWVCAHCKGKVPRSWRWQPPKVPEGMEDEPAFAYKEWPQLNYSTAIA